MNNKDLSLLSEAYNKVQQKTLEEAGFSSQLAARAGAAKDAIKHGLKNIAHVARGEGGNIRNAKGQVRPLTGWKKTYEAGKQSRIAKSLAQDIINDIKYTGLVPAGFTIDQTHVQYWEEAINRYVDFINNRKGRTKYDEETPSSEYASTTAGKETAAA